MENQPEEQWHGAPSHLSFDEKARYKAIKTKVMNRVMVPRDDFVFMRAADRRDKSLAKLRFLKKPRTYGVAGGYNTAPR